MAVLSGASAQLRKMATGGGHVLQRTRCAYFYDGTAACNKREPGSGCDAIGGFNRNHGVLGVGETCIATHPSVALAALDATVEVESVLGVRRIPLVEFHRLPGDTPHLETELAADELITAVELPALPLRRTHAIARCGIGHRSTGSSNSSSAQAHLPHVSTLSRPGTGPGIRPVIRDDQLEGLVIYAFALVSVAAALEVRDGTVTAVRLALGGVAVKPWRAYEAARILLGAPPGEESFRRAAAAELAAAVGQESNTFKIELAQRTIVATLRELLTDVSAA